MSAFTVLISHRYETGPLLLRQVDAHDIEAAAKKALAEFEGRSFVVSAVFFGELPKPAYLAGDFPDKFSSEE